MSNYLVIIVTILYIIASIGYGIDHKYGAAICFFAYALANIGMLITIMDI